MTARRLRIALVVLAAIAAHAAAADAPPVTRVPPSRTIAQLPVSSPTPRLYGITDGTGASDCTTGGGSTYVLCWWDGAAWTAVGSGGDGGVDELSDLAGDLCGTSEILEDQGASWACIATPTGGAADLVDLGDVDVTGAAANSPLVYNGVDTWVDGTHVAASATSVDADGDSTAELSVSAGALLFDPDDDGAAEATVTSTGVISSELFGSAPSFAFGVSSNVEGMGLDGSFLGLYIRANRSEGLTFHQGNITGDFRFVSDASGSNKWFVVDATGVTPDNHLEVDATAAGGSPSLKVAGSDTDISVQLTPKGAGSIVVTSGAIGLPVSASVPFSCTAGNSGRMYMDSTPDPDVPCICNGTGWVQMDDWSTECT